MITQTYLLIIDYSAEPQPLKHLAYFQKLILFVGIFCTQIVFIKFVFNTMEASKYDN